MKRARFLLSTVYLGVLAMALLLALYAKFFINPKFLPASAGDEQALKQEYSTKNVETKTNINLILPDWDKGKLQWISYSEEITGVLTYEIALARLIELTPDFPKGSKLLAVKREGRALLIHFNEAIRNVKTQEQARAVIGALQRTLGAFTEIDKVKIYADNKTCKELCPNENVFNVIRESPLRNY